MTHLQPQQEPRSLRFLGFTVELKSDLVSFVALLLSGFAVVISIANVLTGANSSIVLPETVTVYSQSSNVGTEDFQPPKPFVEFAFPLLAYNDGAADSTALIKSIALQVEYAGITKEYEPVLFGRTLDVQSNGSACAPSGSGIIHAKVACLVVFDEGAFRPLIIRSDDVLQQEVIFVPRYDPNCADALCSFQNFLWTDDISASILNAGKGATPADIELRLTFELPNDGWRGEVIEITCKLSHVDLEKVFPHLGWMSASTCEFS